MVSLITDLKLGLYSVAISASAAFVQREASVFGTCFAIVLALGRSLARALCRFLPERGPKCVSTANNHPRARIPVTRYLSAVISIFYVLFFCIKAHAQTAIDEPFGLSTTAQTAIGATWKELLVEITNDLSIINNCREKPQSCSSLAAIKFMSIAKAGEGHEGLARIGHQSSSKLCNQGTRYGSRR